MREGLQTNFHIDAAPKQIADLLTEAMKAEVEYRKGTFEQDEALTGSIGELADFLVGNNDQSKVGCLLMGVSGNGKTTLIYALKTLLTTLNEEGYLETDNGLARWGFGEVLSAKELTRIAKRNDKDFDSIMKRRMLAIDDLGEEPAEIQSFGNIDSPIVDLLEYRYRRQLFTIISTNLTPQQINKHYGVRVADRFNEMMKTIIFKHNSYRK